MLSHGIIVRSVRSCINSREPLLRRHYQVLRDYNRLSSLASKSRGNGRPLVQFYTFSPLIGEMAKRKRYSTAPVHDIDLSTVPIPSPLYSDICPSPLKRRASQRTRARQRLAPVSTNPDENPEVLDGPEALRASPDAGERDERMALEKVGSVAGTQVKEKDDEVPSLLNGDDSSSSLSEISEGMPPLRRKPAVARAKKPTEVQTVKATTRAKEHNIIPAAKVKTEVMKEPLFLDPEAEGDEEADEEEIQAALSRPPPVNSNYLPLPWKGRLGYVSIHFCHPKAN